MHINYKHYWFAMLILPATSFISEISADPFQFEVSGLLAQFDTRVPNGRGVDGDVLALTALYYLLPVDTSRGPLTERPFLDKSAFVYSAFTQTKPDLGSDSDSISLGARFVTQQDMIFEIDYNKTDTDNGSDSDTLELGVGKYLDNNTTAVLYYGTEDENNSD